MNFTVIYIASSELKKTINPKALTKLLTKQHQRVARIYN